MARIREIIKSIPGAKNSRDTFYNFSYLALFLYVVKPLCQNRGNVGICKRIVNRFSVSAEFY